MAQRMFYINGLIAQRNLRRERVFRDRTNPFDVYSDDELYQRFRFPRNIILTIVDLVSDDLAHPTVRNMSLPPLLQVLIGLRYYASGSYLRVIGDTFCVDISTVSRCVDNITNSLLRHMDEYIHMPANAEETLSSKTAFYDIAGFPGIIGLIDGTQIRIQRPSGVNDQPYINRKGYPAINAQAVCNVSRRFIDIYAAWPGSCHDSHVLRSSNIFQQFEQGNIDGRLLGDSGYPCKPWLLTPYINPQTQNRIRYNNCHTTTRVRVEQAFGLLKRRFLCLHLENRFQPGEFDMNYDIPYCTYRRSSLLK